MEPFVLRVHCGGLDQWPISLHALQIATLSIVAEKDVTFVCADKRLTTLEKTIGFPVIEL